MKAISKALAVAVCAMFTQAFAQGAPYAGQQGREIKALSAQEVDELLAGQGMGFAKAAELNGYPGPAHVLEHAEALGLSAEQRRSTESLMRAHKERAKALGVEVVGAERALDQAFAARRVDAPRLAKLTGAVGEAQARLREEHLRTHIEQTALLRPEQISKYAELRGYGGQSGGAASGGRGHGHGKHH